MPTDASIEFSRRLRAARQYGHHDDPTREVTQRELADALGRSLEPIQAWEAAKRYPAKGDRRGIIVTIGELTGLPAEFFEVDFAELRQAMEAVPTLALDWSPEQEIQAGGEHLAD